MDLTTQKSFLRFIMLLFTTLLFIFIMNPIISASAKSRLIEQSPRKIRVGFSHFPYFSVQNEDGSFSGILHDYTVEIAKYAGWDIEYVMSNHNDILRKLENGEVDIVGGLNKNETTMEAFDLVEFSSGYAYSVLTVNKNFNQYVAGDYNSIQNIRVGVFTKAASRSNAFNRFCKINGLNVELVLYDDAEKWDECLKNGEADARLTNSAKLENDEKIIASFQKESYHFGVTKGNSDVLRELNFALEKIDQVNPSLDNHLYKKYYNPPDTIQLTLTSEEKMYIENNPVLRVVTAPDWSPISYYDKKLNKYSGIAIDFLTLIAELTGFQIDYIETNTFKESLDMLDNGQADLVAGIYNTDYINDNCDMTLSLPYLPTQTVMLQDKNVSLENLDNLTLAMPYGFDFKHNFPNCNTVYYDTITECINSVKHGKSDFTAISNLAVEQYIRNMGNGNLIISQSAYSIMGLSAGFANPTDSRLLFIIDKAINSIPESTKQSILFKNTSSENNKFTFVSIINSNPIQAIGIIGSVSSIIIFLLVFIVRTQFKLSQNTALNVEAYHIIEELSGEYLFEYIYKTRELKLPEKFAALTNYPPIINSSTSADNGIYKLYHAFGKEDNQKYNFNVEFMCTTNNGSNELFHAVCAVLCDSSGRLVRGIGKITNIQAEYDSKKQLEKKANTDSLTGLYNKQYCQSLVQEYSNNVSDINHAAIILIDFDYFKDVNDTLGHLGGDEALKLLSENLRTIFNTYGVIGRWGGDEFLVFITDITNKDNVINDVARLCELMDTSFTYQNIETKLSISTGVAFSTSKTTYDELFQNADTALYTVKNKSRNGYHIYNS